LLDERAVTPLDLSSVALHRGCGGYGVDAAVHQTEIGPKRLRAVTPKGDSQKRDVQAIETAPVSIRTKHVLEAPVPPDSASTIGVRNVARRLDGRG
jgi:hypothetical protein